MKEERNKLFAEITAVASEGMAREDLLTFLVESLNCLNQSEFNEVISKSDLTYKNSDITYSNLDKLEESIVDWAKDRGIIPNGNILTQAVKTLEEVHELIQAIDRKDKLEIDDAYGDIFVTIVIGSYLNGGRLSDYAYKAYNVIKDRKGTLLSNGDFVKEDQTQMSIPAN